MKFVTDIRLLILGIWLGAAIFFIGVAQNAFAVLPQRELAGAVVSRNLSLLNYGGLIINVVLLLTSGLGTTISAKIWVWAERFLLLVAASACAVGQFVIGIWLASVRSQMGRPIDEVPVGDPLRMQFDMLHEYSVWVLMTGMVAALLTFFVIANRKFGVKQNTKADVYDFSKEFKI